MKSLYQMLQEFAYGDYLLGDLDDLDITIAAKDSINSLYNSKYDIPKESNTEDEKKLVKQLSYYIGSWAQIDVDMLHDLLKLKSEFPVLLEPNNHDGYVYRGMTIPIDTAIKYARPGSFVSKSGKIQITSKANRGYLSFSTDRRTAITFTNAKPSELEYAMSKSLIPVMCIAKIDDIEENLLFSPELMNSIGGMQEDEVLYVGNSFTCIRLEWDPQIIYDIKDIISKNEFTWDKYKDFLSIIEAEA